MKIKIIVAVAVAAMGISALAVAQEAVATPPAAADAMIRVPEGTIVELETAEPLSSKTNKRGDKFAIRMIGPLLIDGVEVIPAGTMGVGEVTTVAPASFGGRPGEMMVLARFLTVGGVEVRLRGFQLGNRGRSNVAVAMFVPYGAGIFLTGGNVEIPAGTDAQAKIAQEVMLPPIPPSTPAMAAPAAPAPAAEAEAVQPAS